MIRDKRHILRSGLAIVLVAGTGLGMVGMVASGWPVPRLSGQTPVSATPTVRMAAPAADGAAVSWERGTLPVVHAADLSSAAGLERTFNQLGYDLSLVAAGYVSVPRLVLDTLPEDLDGLEPPETRKSLFVRALLPVILQVNEEIGTERTALLAIRDKMAAGDTLTADEVQQVMTLADSLDQPDADIDALLKKLDLVPPSLALAQAIEESGWGTSRIAQDRNALFGQFGPRVHGRRNYLEFETLTEGVRSYVRNLNSNPAYAKFRSLRAQLRTSDEPGALGSKLAGTLSLYCDRGQDYVTTLRTIIRANGLSAFDTVRLARSGRPVVVAEN